MAIGEGIMPFRHPLPPTKTMKQQNTTASMPYLRDSHPLEVYGKEFARSVKFESRHNIIYHRYTNYILMYSRILRSDSFNNS